MAIKNDTVVRQETNTSKKEEDGKGGVGWTAGGWRNSEQSQFTEDNHLCTNRNFFISSKVKENIFF